MSALDRYSPTAAIQPYHRPAIRKIDQYIRAVGGGDVARGTERVLACLCLSAHTDERLDLLLSYAEDPSLAGRSFGDLAIISGFRAGELIKILKETGLMVAQAHSTQIVADHLPAVVQDIVARAQNHWVACQACDATGKVTPEPTKEQPNPGPEDCEDCRGKGQILVPADPDRQDRVLEMARMLPESKGTSIGVGVNIHKGAEQPGLLPAGSMGALFSQFVSATDRVLHPDRGRRGDSAFSVQPSAAVPSTSDVAPLEAVVVSPDDPTPPADA